MVSPVSANVRFSAVLVTDTPLQVERRLSGLNEDAGWTSALIHGGVSGFKKRGTSGMPPSFSQPSSVGTSRTKPPLGRSTRPTSNVGRDDVG